MKYIYIIILLLITVHTLHAQSVITGKVFDQNGNTLAGVEFYLTESKVSKTGVSDSSGLVTITSIPESTKYLYYHYVGENEYTGSVGIQDNTFDLVISENSRVINLGNGMQTSNELSSHSSVTLYKDELSKSSERNVKEALYGQLAGLYVTQSGSMTVRGRSTFGSNAPLVLVDGFERDLNFYSIGEIESVTVLKDAVAAAKYGVRGANGVIVVTTVRGKIGKPEIEVSYNNNQYSHFRPIEMASAPAYANALNEALLNDGLDARYSPDEIALFESGAYPYEYPNVNWSNEVFNDRPSGHLFHFSARGGSDRFKYAASTSYAQDGGYYKGLASSARKDDKLSNTALNIRANVDIDVTKSTTFSVGLLTHLRESAQPGALANAINNSVYNIPAAAFPVYSGEEKVFASNAFYGRNPVAMVNYTGFNKNIDQSLFFDARLKQDLSAFLPGLSAEAALSYDFRSLLRERGSREYKYDVIAAQIDSTGNVISSKTSFGEDTPMDYDDAIIGQFINNNIEAKLNYNKSTSSYQLNTSLIYEQSFYFTQGRNNTSRRQAYKAFGSLVLDNKYLIDAAVNYAGTSKLQEGDRFRLYPAVSAAWIISKEPFFGDSEKTSLKVRGSFGISGSDLYPHDLYRTNFTSGGSIQLNNNPTNYGSTKPGQLPVLNLTNETAQKADFGIDLSLFNKKLSLVTELFYENRTQILVPGESSISGVLGLEISEQLEGIINTKGFESSLAWQDKVNDFEYNISGNFTYARAKVIENNEGFLPYDYLSKKGNSINARYGLESMGYFSNDDDIVNSPAQMFSEVKPGDIKYKNQNPGADQVIDQLDLIKLSDYGASPEIYYGLDIHLKYKGLGFYALLQGVANRSIYTNSSNVFFPLQNNTNISTYYLEQRTRWTPATAAVADAPRLTTQSNANNFRASDVWIENGSYLKLRNIEVSYILSAFGFETKFFIRGANLISLDKLKDFDPENYSIGYPSLSSFTMGVHFKF